MQVDGSLKPEKQRDAAVALVKAGGQKSFEQQAGDLPVGSQTYGTDIDGLVQP